MSFKEKIRFDKLININLPLAALLCKIKIVLVGICNRSQTFILMFRHRANTFRIKQHCISAFVCRLIYIFSDKRRLFGELHNFIAHISEGYEGTEPVVRRSKQGADIKWLGIRVGWVSMHMIIGLNFRGDISASLTHPPLPLDQRMYQLELFRPSESSLPPRNPCLLSLFSWCIPHNLHAQEFTCEHLSLFPWTSFICILTKYQIIFLTVY